MTFTAGAELVADGYQYAILEDYLDDLFTVDFPALFVHERQDDLARLGVNHVQRRRIREAAVKRSFSKFPADLLDGYIMLGDTVLDNQIPIPQSHKGNVELLLASRNDEVVLITGRSTEVELIGQPKYVEEFRT